MRKRLFILCAMMFSLTILTTAQNIFQKILRGTNPDEARCVQQTTDGGYIVTGTTLSFGTGYYDIFLIKFNANGDTVWTKTFGGTDYDDAWSVQQTTDGGYIIAGNTRSFGSGFGDAYLIKTDVNGDLLWSKAIGGTSTDQAFSVQQTTDGGYIATGYSASFNTGDFDVYLIKTDANGNSVWTKTFGAADTNDYGNSVQQTNDGGYIITGYTGSFGAGGDDVYLIKTDSNGDTLWTKTFGGTNNDKGNSVKQTADGGYIIAGSTYSFSSGIAHVYLIKADINGDTLWTKIFDGVGGIGYSIQETTDTGYIIAGIGNQKVYLIKTNSSGDTLWTKAFGETGFEDGFSVYQTTDGGFIVTGITNTFQPSGDYDIFLIKTNAAGNSGCYESNPPAIILPTATQVSHSASIVITPNTIVTTPTSVAGSAGFADSTRCLTICTPPSATIVPAGAQVFCSGESVTLSSNSGTGFTYRWFKNGSAITGATNQTYIAATPSNYSVEVTKNCGIDTSSTVTVTVNSVPSATITPSGPTTFCAGESVMLNVSYGTNKIYQWKKGGVNIAGATLSSYTATTGGTYKVTVTNTVTGCSKTTASGTVVTVNPSPAATITPQGPTTFCAGGSVLLKGNSGTGFTYQWKKGGSNIAGVTNKNYTATLAGVYKVKVTNSYGCSKLSTGITVTVPCREEETVSENIFDVKVFPNPSPGDFVFEVSNTANKKNSIAIYDVIGKLVYSEDIFNSHFTIRHSQLSPGIYSAVVINGENKKVLKLVKTN